MFWKRGHAPHHATVGRSETSRSMFSRGGLSRFQRFLHRTDTISQAERAYPVKECPAGVLAEKPAYSEIVSSALCNSQCFVVNSVRLVFVNNPEEAAGWKADLEEGLILVKLLRSLPEVKTFLVPFLIERDL